MPISACVGSRHPYLEIGESFKKWFNFSGTTILSGSVNVGNLK